MGYRYQYPHPAVTTDSVVFGFDGKRLHLLLTERNIQPFKGDWALPGGFIRMDETIEQCAKRKLYEETGLKDIYMEQFHVFSDIERDPRERVITVAFFALIKKTDYRLIADNESIRASWFEVDELPPLAFDHLEIVRMAREHLQEVLKVRPIAFKLLDEQFSMPELQRLYEIINDTTYDRRNFARKMNTLYCVTEDIRMTDEPPKHSPRTRPNSAKLYSFDNSALNKKGKGKEKRE